MNQGRIWTVVSPSVGLPLLLGSVAITALLVHFALLTHTTWVPGFFEGKKHVSAIETTSPPVAYLPSNVSIS
jgi:light-harvesting protein B-800-850 alpha chain